MWVQEGGDCKDNETEITSSLFSRFYGTRKKKQTVTTIGIPMRRPSVTMMTKKTDSRADDERKASSESPKIASVAKANPVSPAQFLENIGTSDAKIDQDDKDLDSDKRSDLLPMFDIDDTNDDQDGDEMNADGLDLTVVGTRIDIPDRVSSPGIDDDFAMQIDAEMASMNMNDAEIGEQSKKFASVFDDEPEEEEAMENPYKFNGLDITKLSEWEECITFTTKQSGLLIVEIYSSVFGPSNVMYSLISDFLNERGKQHKVKFVRMNLNKFNQIEETKQVITEYKKYLIASPVPTFILIRNGAQVHELQGTRPTELQLLIETYSKPVSRPQSAQPLEYKKYASILASRSRPQSASTYFPTDKNNKENQAPASKVENIRNLIKDMNVSSNAFVSSSTASPTKLSKNAF